LPGFQSRTSKEKRLALVFHEPCYDYDTNRRDFLIGMSLAPLVVGQSKTASSSKPLEFMSALEAAEAIRRKKISSVELTRLVFDRIDRYNSALNAFAYQLRDDALARATKADNARGSGSARGVFHGVPFFVKESFSVAQG